jgi:hypothetical protein
MMAQDCPEVVDVLWKATLIGVAGFFVYRWAIKTGVTQGEFGSRGAKYLAGRVKSWGA